MATLQDSPAESTPAESNGNYPSEPLGGAVDQHAGMVHIEVVCEGISPLLMNAMSEQQLLAIWFKQKAPKTATRRQPREEAESKLHKLPDGRPHIPVKCLQATFVNAGQFVRLDGKRQISTEKKTILPSMLALLDTELPLTLPGSKKKAIWEVDIQQGRNPNGGEAVCIIRPRFDLWALNFTIEVDQSLMSVGMARELIDIAGKRVGLLEFSPRHKGTFGRFHVTEWRITKKRV
jgi:hypothetical protein